MVQILSTLIAADGGEMPVAGHDLAKDADAVRAAIGVTGQFSAVDNLLTGTENLLLRADCTTWTGARADGAPPRCSTNSTCRPCAVRLPLGEKTVQPPRRPVMAPGFSGSL